AVAYVEDDAALARFNHIRPDAPRPVDRRVGEGPEAMGEHVAAAKSAEHLQAAGRRLVYMRHDRQLQAICRPECEVDRRNAPVSSGYAARAHLEPDDQVGMLATAIDCFHRIAKPQIPAFADHDAAGKAEDAGKGDIEVGEDADIRALDDMAAEAEEIA